MRKAMLKTENSGTNYSTGVSACMERGKSNDDFCRKNSQRPAQGSKI